MHYEEEQEGEVSALSSIYGSELEVVSDVAPRAVVVCVRRGRATLRLRFGMGARYPDEAAHVRLAQVDGLQLEDVAELQERLEALAADNVGTVMIFTLAAAAQDWLDDKSDELEREKERGATQKRLAEEEAERKRFEGTRVTVESFLAWRNNFETETGIASKREKEAKESRKSTGRELFLRDATLNQSDLELLDDGDAVKVDESLFQELDELDLSDDEDYVPGRSDDDDD